MVKILYVNRLRVGWSDPKWLRVGWTDPKPKLPVVEEAGDKTGPENLGIPNLKRFCDSFSQYFCFKKKPKLNFKI